MTEAILTPLGKRTVRTKCALGNVHKGLFNLSAKAITNVLNEHLRVRRAVFSMKRKQIRFLEVWPEDFFLKRRKLIEIFIGDVFCPGRYCSR